jgi:PAS domain S-box-containing protein
VQVSVRERPLATLLETLEDAVLATDIDLRITRINPAGAALVGWDAHDVLRRRVDEVIVLRQPGTAKPIEGPAARAAREGIVVALADPAELVARDGTAHRVAGSAVPIKAEDGTVIGVIVVFREQRPANVAASDSAQTARVELENTPVQEANRAKSSFLAGMSHEMRTPLNAILGFAELLHDDVVAQGTPEYHEFLANILASGADLLRLVNDMLDIAKVEAGKVVFHPQECALDALIAEVFAMVQSSAVERGVELIARGGVATAVVDPVRFKQVLYNFLSNAIKFTPSAGRVVVRTVAEGTGVRLEVEDTGIGIAPEDIERLFIDFQRVGAGTAGGTGLGLALTRKLVEAQGGTVGVRSTLRMGSSL